MLERVPPPKRSHYFVAALLKSLAVALIAIGGWSAVPAQGPAKGAPATAKAPELTPQEQIEQLQKKVAQLSGEVARLRAELAKLEKYRQIDYTRGLIIAEENRIRDWQSDLNDIAAKQTALNKRLDEIEKELEPDRIERNMAGVGSTRPEEERNAVTRQLANEKRHVQSQLETLRSNRTRILGLIGNAEASIARLKQRLSELSR